MPSPDDVSALRAVARGVLEANRVAGRRATRPAPGQYPHQWYWDSGFIALGWAGVAAHRAIDELEALFAGQWGNGMVPHILYDASASAERQYFPESARWGIAAVPRDRGPSTGVQTSGLTQPPMAAIAAAHIARVHADDYVRAALHRLYPKLLAAHRFLMTERDPERIGLAFQVHPWETGLDNSPRWQRALDAVVVDRSRVPAYERRDTALVPAGERPTDTDYDTYAYLIEIYKEHAYAPSALFEHCPFVVYDVLFNAILHRANEALADLATRVGEPTGEIEGWLDRTRSAFAERLWDDALGRYCDIDVRAADRINENTIATFVPLYAGLASPAQAQRLVREHLTNRDEYWPGGEHAHFVVPTVSKNSASFEPDRYWRGPVWLNTNWLVAEGLRRYGFEAEAAKVRDDSLRLVAGGKGGGDGLCFWEYYNPWTGQGRGAVDFSWTAALALAFTEGEAGDG